MEDWFDQFFFVENYADREMKDGKLINSGFEETRKLEVLISRFHVLHKRTEKGKMTANFVRISLGPLPLSLKTMPQDNNKIWIHCLYHEPTDWLKTVLVDT